jgi:hypothetical protein
VRSVSIVDIDLNIRRRPSVRHVDAARDSESSFAISSAISIANSLPVSRKRAETHENKHQLQFSSHTATSIL